MEIRNEITEYLDSMLIEECYYLANKHDMWNTLRPSKEDNKMLLYFPGANRGEVLLNEDGSVNMVLIYRIKKPLLSCYSVKERKLNQVLNERFKGLKLENIPNKTLLS